jgi:hypothetical protein
MQKYLLKKAPVLKNKTSPPSHCVGHMQLPDVTPLPLCVVWYRNLNHMKDFAKLEETVSAQPEPGGGDTNSLKSKMS